MATLTPTCAPMVGTIAAVLASPGDQVVAGRPVVVIESMKMEHEVVAASSGTVRDVIVSLGQTVGAGDELLLIEDGVVAESTAGPVQSADPTAIRPDLQEVLDRRAATQDAARPDIVAKRHSYGRRTARENLNDLCDPGTFVEYGGFAVAAQRARRTVDDLIMNTVADGFIGGTAHINGHLFSDELSRCAVMSYDYMVLAGTQGYQGHRKKDRLFELAERSRLPVVLFAEGGGGRPGDTDAPGVSGLDVMAFALFGRLSGLVPMVGIASGRCFAGNAALLGCCDVIIATEDASVGMAGPAMIEGGGLGQFEPDEVGPVSVQYPNGVIDVLVEDDAASVSAAKQYLSYFQGKVGDWEAADQRELRAAIPEDRLRVYDVRRVIKGVADIGSVLELRGGWAPGIVTSLARLEGRPVGVIANNPGHLGGAIDSDGADKAARFMQLCDAHDLPIVFLCDTPGFMVGPEAEKTAQVRHFSRMFVVGASLTVPFATVVLRKGYGLGAQAMAGGSFHAPALTVAWPTGEIGGMGLEGAVRLGFRKELEAEEDPGQRQALFERLVASAYRNGKALNAATHFELDDVIDPAETRSRLISVLRAAPVPPHRDGKKRPWIDTW
ncbi:MAG TPA: carboxyl transferase domain-containing protein [Acidimicrobiales bacterium]